MTVMGQNPTDRIVGRQEPSLLDQAELREADDDPGSLDTMLAEADRGWDIETQVLTLKQAAATTVVMPAPEAKPVSRRATKSPSRPPPPLPRRGPPPLPAAVRGPDSSPVPPLTREMAQPGTLIDLLNARVAALEAASSRKEPSSGGVADSVGLARAHMELAVASEMSFGDDALATRHAEAAVRADPTFGPAHAMLRRTKHARSALPEMLAHLESEIDSAASEPNKTELLAEKARLLDAAVGEGNATTAGVRAAWEQALAGAPNHAAALKGLETILQARALATTAPADWDSLATHLGKMAGAYGSELPLAAWLHVERAQILERKLGRIESAREALERALLLDPSIGPVRGALVRHAAARADWGTLARLLEEEAGIESNVARKARLELDAALIAAARLDDRALARSLLERAAARAPTVPSVDRRVLDELIRLSEADAQWAQATRARRARLSLFTNPDAIAFELRSLAAAAESEGDIETAIADVQRALAANAADPTLVETLDRLLSQAGLQEQRIALWLHEAACAEDPPTRAGALVEAAHICESLGRRADAIRHLRSAWVAVPGDTQVLDALCVLLTPSISEPVNAGTRSLIELYSQAADHAREPGRKIAYLERVALLWEEILGDAGRATQAYEEVLALDPDRRSALLGLARTANRIGDARGLARALLDEARLTADDARRLALRTRAADVLASDDPSRARQLVREILDHDATHGAARVLETRLEEEAGRWETVAKSLRARIDAAPTPRAEIALWLALAQVQSVRLHKPLDAMASLERAHKLDPSHPVPAEEIARVLEDHGDVRVLREALERLAGRAATPDDRVRYLTRVAEIDELRLRDDASAMRTYKRALVDAPDDDLLVERLTRVALRLAQQPKGSLAELAALLGSRVDRAASQTVARAVSFDLASLLIETGQEPTRAVALLESTLSEQSDAYRAPALRTLESVARRAGDQQQVARVLSRQAKELVDARARLGAMWNLATLEEWWLQDGDPSATYGQILELDPTDPGAREGTLRRELAGARSGDPRARKNVADALRALVAFASDEDARVSLQVRLAIVLEASAAAATDARVAETLLREALQRYRDALRIDDLSACAAHGVARLSSKLGDVEGALAAARSIADLTPDPRARARCLVDAAELLLGPEDDERLGTRPQRRQEAAVLLERALKGDPESIAAASRLVVVLREQGRSERLVSAFRTALGHAKSPESVVFLGTELARVARDELNDLPVAIDAMRRVRAAVPHHVPSLLTLAELCIGQRVWPEAVDALEAVAATSVEAPPKLTALFALASIYEKVLSRDKDVDRVVRAALAIDPNNPRALRAVLRRIASAPAEEDERASVTRRKEIANLLGRLAEVENDAKQKSGILLELADVQQRLGDATAAERALVEAVAFSPPNARALARLGTHFRRPNEPSDPVGHARALGAVIALGQQLGMVDARWFATLGQIEIQALSRVREGIAHLERAVTLDPSLYESRFELASAHARLGSHAEVTRVILGMLTPSAHALLSISDPAAALALLEQSLSVEKLPNEAIVVSELRNLAGELDENRCAWLRNRQLAPIGPSDGTLDRSILVTQVLPAEGRHILLEVAAAIAGVEAKMLRFDLAEAGLSVRDRVGPRGGHPTRVLFDRVARQLGLADVELAISAAVSGGRVLAQEVPWVVVPAAIVAQPEMTQVAILASAMARIAYGVPWLDELPPGQIGALLVAAARQVVPGYTPDASDGLSDKAIAQNEAAIARILSRRQRRLLEDLAPHIAASQSRPAPLDTLLGALSRAQLRVAFLLTGDLLTVAEQIRSLDGTLQGATQSPGQEALAAVLHHSLAGDVVRFALTPEATALRRRVGSTWNG